MNVEKTEIWITSQEPLLENYGYALRGFWGNMYRNRGEFHHHVGNKLIYRHPLIQYKVLEGSALVIGLKEGAYLLKAIPDIEYLELHQHRYPIMKQIANNITVPFGLIESMVGYNFETSWIGLNEKNYQLYLKLKETGKSINVMLEKILIGNILSMCKSIGYTVNDKLNIKSNLEESVPIEVKKHVKLITFKGQFEVNFLIPDFWGIGGKVSLGYGTVKRKYGGVGQ